MNISQTIRGPGLGQSSATHTCARKRLFAGGLIFLSFNAIWQMNGLTLTTSGALPTVTDLGWTIVGVGDTNADGQRRRSPGSLDWAPERAYQRAES